MVHVVHQVPVKPRQQVFTTGGYNRWFQQVFPTGVCNRCLQGAKDSLLSGVLVPDSIALLLRPVTQDANQRLLVGACTHASEAADTRADNGSLPQPLMALRMAFASSAGLNLSVDRMVGDRSSL